jgi:ATP-dependent Clp protease adaptor protein ClpS
VEDGIALIILATSLIGACGAAFAFYRTTHRTRRFMDEMQAIALAAMMEARERKHDVIDVEHVAWALLYDQELVDALYGHGVSVAELRRSLNERLAQKATTETPPSPATQAPFSPEARVVLQAARAIDEGSALPAVLRALLALSSVLDRDSFERAGIRAERAFSITARDLAPPPALPAAPPFRSPSRPPVARVVFWNDGVTKMDLVVEILRTSFDMSEAQALYTMLRVHRVGRAVVRSCAAVEAETLAARATALARARGAPLRVTVERMDDARA